jgi:hypothetical protein
MSNRRQKLKAAAAAMPEPDASFAPLMLGDFRVPAFDGVSAVFGARMRDYPPMATIPAEFRTYSGTFQDIVSALFFNGGSLAEHGLKLKSGISHKHAMTAIHAYMSSFDPPHEHKTAAVAWALSEWTEPQPLNPTGNADHA